MPVRIVKDDANESVLSDYFNFDNPQGTQSYNNNNNNNDSRNQTTGSGNGFLSFLGSIAIDACMHYAYNAFMGGGKKQQSNNGGGGRGEQRRVNYDEANDVLQERLTSAELCVSLWAHTALADGSMQQAERGAVDQLVQDTVRSLFPQDIADQTEASSILQKRLTNPLSLQDVVRQASNDQRFALKLYEQTCMIVGADEATHDKENIFLANLASDLRISTDDNARLRSQYNLI